MPAHSRTLEEEGVVIPPTRLDDDTLHDLTERMRNPRQREADLRAQLAAGRAGAERVGALIERVGLAAYRDGMEETLDYAERRTRARIDELEDGVREATDVLEADEGDVRLQLRATVEGDQLTLDLSGSADQHEGNLNCPLAVTLSACYFALRVLTDPDVPPCEGAYRPVRVIAPEGSLLNARPPAAVAAGNVETSSRVADLVLGAFGHALGQGTMNNLTLGNDDFTYYETLGGGQGACADADGPSAVHVAMSNTLNTPIEALELEFPVRAVEYSVRRGSGGAGQPEGRGRGGARARGARRDALFAHHRAPPPPSARSRRRRSGRAGPQLTERRGAARQGVGHPRAGRPPAHRDARRRRSRRRVTRGRVSRAPQPASALLPARAPGSLSASRSRHTGASRPPPGPAGRGTGQPVSER